MYLTWLAWFLASLGSFAGLEAYAIIKDQPTLSQSIADLTAAFPLVPYIFGVAAGGLAVHFWWHWNPK